MANFLIQAGSDFWDILRKKLPESFGMQWGIPDVPDMAKPAGMARAALNAYQSLPTFSNQDITKGIQGRVALSGIGPKFNDNPTDPAASQARSQLNGSPASSDTGSSVPMAQAMDPSTAIRKAAGDLVPNAAAVSSSSDINPEAMKARATLNIPPATSTGLVPQTREDIVRLLEAGNTGTGVSEGPQADVERRTSSPFERF